MSIPSVPPTPTITFKSEDWSVKADQPLVAGKKVIIDYDLARLPYCRGKNNNGTPAWSISGFSQINDDPIRPFSVAGETFHGPPNPVIDLYAPGQVKIWFAEFNRWGCNTWDSHFGDGFTFEVNPSGER